MMEGDGVGELQERGADENLEDRRNEKPRGDAEPKREERAGLVETCGLGGGGRRVRSRGGMAHGTHGRHGKIGRGAQGQKPKAESQILRPKKRAKDPNAVVFKPNVTRLKA